MGTKRSRDEFDPGPALGEVSVSDHELARRRPGRPSTSNTPLFVGFGLAALVGVGGLIFFLTRPEAPVAEAIATPPPAVTPPPPAVAKAPEPPATPPPPAAPPPPPPVAVAPPAPPPVAPPPPPPAPVKKKKRVAKKPRTDKRTEKALDSAVERLLEKGEGAE